MSSIVDIEAAIERLPEPQLDQLERWLQQFRQRRQAPVSPVDGWLQRARGVAAPGASTEKIMHLTRDAE